MVTADPTPTTNVMRVIRMVAGIRVTIQNKIHLSTLQCVHFKYTYFQSQWKEGQSSPVERPLN